MILAGILAAQSSSSQPPSAKSFRAVQASTNPSPYGFYEFLPEGYNNQSSVPLLIFLHGSDERGNGNSELNRVLTWGPPKMANAGTFNENMIMLAPQWLGANDDNYYTPEDVKDFITYAKSTYKVDENRIYLNGVSAGSWLLMYYLQNYPTDHETAASVIISGNAYEGYTDPAIIATANSPLWMISNIGDPLVPWDDTFPPIAEYINVVDTRDGINAVTSGMVEKLTGFVEASHTGTWDGIYDSSLIGDADPAYDPFDESIYDWLLDHTLIPTSGRTFNVGTGSGDLTIDGSNLIYEGSPTTIQNGDIIEIEGGTYNSITTTNLSVNETPVIIKNVNDESITSKYFYIEGSQKNINYKFDNNGSVLKGLTLIMESQETMHIDRAAVGNVENINISGIKYIIENTTPDGGIFIRHSQDSTISYANGSGTTALKNISIENIEFDFTARTDFSPWYLMSFNKGELSTSTDTNFIDGIIIRNIRATGPFYTSTAIEIKNCQNALIDDVYFDSLNNDWTDNPPHARIILVQGQGIIENCYMRNGMGNVAVIWGYNRLANSSPSIIRNCMSYNSFRYSTAEIQGFSNLIVSGISEAPHYKMLGLVADTLDTGNYFSGCAGDIYPLLGGTFEARNSVSINGHSNNSGQNNTFNNMAGGTGTLSNNAVYANRTLAGVEDETYIPQLGSPLIGAGIANIDMVDDYYGNIRPNPPAIGAAELI